VSGKLRAWGSESSYFTGKLGACLRDKEIPYDRVPATGPHFSKTLPRKTGAIQVPALEPPGGRWISDTMRSSPGSRRSAQGIP
jgi:glutathione S-transferase